MISYIPLFIPFFSYFFPLIPHLSSTFSSLILFILYSSLSLVIITFLLHLLFLPNTFQSRPYSPSLFFSFFPARVLSIHIDLRRGCLNSNVRLWHSQHYLRASVPGFPWKCRSVSRDSSHDPVYHNFSVHLPLRISSGDHASTDEVTAERRRRK